MGNPTLPNIDQHPDSFDTAHNDEFVTLKQNYDSAGNLIGALPTSLIAKQQTAEYGNRTDDLIRQLVRKGYGIQNMLDKRWGIVGDGTDETDKVQNFFDSLPTDAGIVALIPKPLVSYGISSPILLTERATRAYGTGMHNVGFSKVGGGSLSAIFEVRANNVEISGLQLNADNGGRAVYVRGCANAYIHGNLMLAATNDSGDAVVLDNRNASGTPIPGAYGHVIANNYANGDGRSFQRFVHADATDINDLSIYGNRVISDTPIVHDIAVGGGNRIFDNLFQSRTGTTGTPAGTCINHTSGQVLVRDNYIERYDVAFEGGTGFPYGYAKGLENNEFDNCRETTARVQEFTADGQTLTPTHPIMLVNGAPSVARIGALIQTGYPGQKVRIRGYTWAVTFDSSATNLQLHLSGDPKFSNVSTEIASMDIGWEWADDAVTYKWVESGRQTRP